MTLGELAARLGCELRGDPAREVRRLATIRAAGPEDIAFVVGARYREALRASEAGAVIVPPALADDAPCDRLVVDDPYLGYATVSWLLDPEPLPAPGVHPSAVVDVAARVAASASIGPFVVVGADSEIGERTVIGAHSVIGEDCRVGADCRLFARVTLGERVALGVACRVQSGAVIGAEGFGHARAEDGWRAIRQSGGVRIGARVQIGANTTIDSGAIEPTVIADGVILDNQIQIAHNVRIGENTAIAGCTGIAGSTRIGRDCLIGGACDIVGHVEIADGVVLNAASFVSRSIGERGRYGSGPPLQRERDWRRGFVALGRLDGLFRRVARLERKLGVVGRGAAVTDAASAANGAGGPDGAREESRPEGTADAVRSSGSEREARGGTAAVADGTARGGTGGEG